jgi:hypothetical protein
MSYRLSETKDEYGWPETVDDFISNTSRKAVESAVDSAVDNAWINNLDKANKQRYNKAYAAVEEARAVLKKLTPEEQAWAHSPERRALDAAQKEKDEARSEELSIDYLKKDRANKLKGVKGKKANRTFGEELYTDEMITSMGSGDFTTTRQHGWDSGGGSRRTKNTKYYNKRRGTKRHRSKRHRSKRHRSKKHRA